MTGRKVKKAGISVKTGEFASGGRSADERISSCAGLALFNNKRAAGEAQVSVYPRAAGLALFKNRRAGVKARGCPRVAYRSDCFNKKRAVRLFLYYGFPETV